ncbi:MAG: 5-carboxymethyl-2-hydroxymuconate Delta-isomerase [bacterium]|nr:5-carboxymethyl-2-hydroxymuconate Delta-isomerase [bacterium]
MPHFIIDCSIHIIEQKLPENILQKVFYAAASTGLFLKDEIKVRISPFQFYRTGNSNDNFIHVFAYIMEGRSADQKVKLSEKIVTDLQALLPDVPIISVSIVDFEKATYSNKETVANQSG